MNKRFSCGAVARLSAITLISLVFAAGCSPRPSADELNAGLRRAGVAGDIVFQEKGGPIDVAGPSLATLSLEEAIRLALATDPEVQAALSRVRAAEADADQMRLLPNPIVSIIARFPEHSGKPILDVDLGIELLGLIQRPGQIQAADHRLRGASAEALSAVLDTISEVEEKYASVQALDAQMPILAEQRSLIAKLLNLAQDRLNKGEGTRLDVTTLQTQEVELEVDIAEKHLERRQERLALARLIGTPSGDANWELSAWSAPARIGSEQAWIAAALQRRPEVESQEWELKALGVETELAKFSPFEQAEIGAGSERDDKWSVGPAVSVPILLFDWGQAKRAKAAALEAEASHKLTNVRRTVVTEVRSAYEAYIESMTTMELARDRLVPSQTQRRKEAEAAYLAGQADIASLILADEDLQSARMKLIELQEKASSQIVKLERAVGGPGIAESIARPLPSTSPATTQAMEQP